MLGLRTKAAAAFGHPEVRAGKTVLANQWEFGSRQSCVSAGRKGSCPALVQGLPVILVCH